MVDLTKHSNKSIMSGKFMAGVIISVLCTNYLVAQNINGKIISSESPVTILKIWGSHQERGFAYGYLLGEKISQTFATYSNSISKCKYRKLRGLIENQNCLEIDEAFLNEAKSMIDGMNKAKTNSYHLDHIDLLIINSIFDISGIKCLSRIKSFACSSLMSWGEATKGTDLNGASVISRHFDWFNSDGILNNQVILIHIPSESNEQPWLNIGIAGQIGVTSAINKSGVSAFLHTAPFTALKGSNDKEYTPVMFALRKGIESKNVNADQQDDIFDILAVLSASKNGFSRPCIVSALAPATGRTSDRIAMVAELIPDFPYLVLRGNEYEDEIPGDNLYTANSLLKFKSRRQHGNRNKDMISALGEGKNISSEKNWELMRDHSRFKVPLDIETNIQFMQYIPEMNILKLSVSTDKTPAYLQKPVSFDLNYFFSTP